jgi:phospholipase C
MGGNGGSGPGGAAGTGGSSVVDAGGDGDAGPSDGAAEGGDGAPVDGGRSDAPTCPSPVAIDVKAGARSSCTFKAGATPLDTIGISAAERTAIPIRHVIILMRENRTYDEYFGQLNKRGQPDSEAVPATFVNGNVRPYHETTTCVKTDPDHSWDGLHKCVNGGRMDGFVSTSGTVTMGYYDEPDLPFYYFLAKTFALADRNFPSVLGPTYPNRDFLVLGTSDGIQCTCSQFPRAGLPSLMDALEKKGLTWAAYSEQNDPMEGTLGNPWRDSHTASRHTVNEFKAALASGNLPEVAFVDSEENVIDEHPPADVQAGEAWSRTLYEALLKSSIWPTTAMIWTFDEGGGFADHVPPPKSCAPSASESNFTELGVRVPMIVISPYARRHYVSHVVHEHTSITRFIETVFDLPALTARDANSDALLDMFDFACPPNTMVPDAPAAGTGGCR